jgi:hypothetical protein
MITHAGQILHASAANEHDRVLLQIVPFAGNVGDDFLPFVNRTFATLRSAEFGFFGVRVITCTQTPRRCGQFTSAGDLDFTVTFFRPFRTSWLIVGILKIIWSMPPFM